MPNWVALPPPSLFSVPQKVTRDKNLSATFPLSQVVIITGHSTALGDGLLATLLPKTRARNFFIF
jgi:hypothetical protein